MKRHWTDLDEQAAAEGDALKRLPRPQGRGSATTKLSLMVPPVRSGKLPKYKPVKSVKEKPRKGLSKEALLLSKLFNPGMKP
jgi:hypothetical protein